MYILNRHLENAPKYWNEIFIGRNAINMIVIIIVTDMIGHSLHYDHVFGHSDSDTFDITALITDYDRYVAGGNKAVVCRR